MQCTNVADSAVDGISLSTAQDQTSCSTESLSPQATAQLLQEILGDEKVAHLDSGEAAPGVRRRLLSPFEIHFSQSHIRPEFQDGRTIEEALQSMKRKLCTGIKDGEASEFGFSAEAGKKTEASSPPSEDTWWLVMPNFPEIEVIQWRCKLRQENGTIKMDSMGNELYGEREWYTLDNRRLYCLQRAAVAFYPKEVRCVVTVITQDEGTCREFRKFRTPDLGRTVGIGHRVAGELPRWSWRKEVGLPALPAPQGIALPRTGRPRKRSYFNQQKGSEPDDDGEQSSIIQNMIIFVLVYTLLRIVFFIGRRLAAGGGQDANATLLLHNTSGEL